MNEPTTQAMLIRPSTTTPTAPLLQCSVCASTSAAIRSGVIAAIGMAIQCRRIMGSLSPLRRDKAKRDGCEEVRPVLDVDAQRFALRAADAADRRTDERA